MWYLLNVLPPAPEVPDEVQEGEPGSTMGIESHHRADPEVHRKAFAEEADAPGKEGSRLPGDGEVLREELGPRAPTATSRFSRPNPRSLGAR
jgi:hypothetical protein